MRCLFLLPAIPVHAALLPGIGTAPRAREQQGAEWALILDEQSGQVGVDRLAADPEVPCQLRVRLTRCRPLPEVLSLWGVQRRFASLDDLDLPLATLFEVKPGA